LKSHYFARVLYIQKVVDLGISEPSISGRFSSVWRWRCCKKLYLQSRKDHPGAFQHLGIQQTPIYFAGGPFCFDEPMMCVQMVISEFMPKKIDSKYY